MNTQTAPLPVGGNEPSAYEGVKEMVPASLEGQTLGKYRVLEPLGRGGMARVYRAYHPQLDRYVAIKVLRSDLADDEEFLIRFQREAQAVAALRHANIVQVFDFDVQGETYYMVMELLEGDTLKTRLSDYRTRGEKMPLGEMVRVLLDVLDGLAYAHSEGMIHRDIKSANVLLTKRGQAVVADFGIAQIVGSTRFTMSGALMGTLNYMAPEQGLKGESDVRSDIYSLGIVFYEMLTQRTPFEADTPLAILMKHLNDPLPLPRQIDPSIPEPFERVVLKALAKDPVGRYQSAEEMARALRAAAEEAEVELPSRISLPFSFTTEEAPSESVAVFSGSARRRLADAEFAADDTDESLGRKLAAGKAQPGTEALREAGKDFLGAMGVVAQAALNKATGVLRDAAEVAKSEISQRRPSADGEGQAEEPAAETPMVEAADWEPAGEALVEPSEQLSKKERRRLEKERQRQERPRGRVGSALLAAIGIPVIGNLCMLTGAAPVGYWQIYEKGWPIQIFLVSWGLSVIMYVASSIWMLIPIGPALMTGVLLAYCQLTGNWEHWVFLWVFEVWAVAISILAPIMLRRSERFTRGVSRPIALVLSVVSIAMIALVGLYVGMDTVIAWIEGFTRMIVP